LDVAIVGSVVNSKAKYNGEREYWSGTAEVRSDLEEFVF
jgi:hypothetical protein